MSASVPHPWLRGRVSLVCGLFLLASSPLLATAGRLNNCTHPLMPEHGGFHCDPSPCRGFPHKTSIRFFCEPGYHISKVCVSRCLHGRWHPPIPACIPIKEGPNMNHTPNDSRASTATAMMGLSVLLFTTTACLIVRSCLCPCQSHSSRCSSDQLDSTVDELPVSLPSYEEVVYGSCGQRLPTCSAPGPTQSPDCPLLSIQIPDSPPPPYAEVEQLHVALSDDKDT